MTRKEGFIEIDKMLNEIDVDTTSIRTIRDSNKITRIKSGSSRIHFSFIYNGTKYYYKSDPNSNPYSELLINCLANDYGIPSVLYDLATVKDTKGVISKDFTKPNTNIISGKDIIVEYIKYLNKKNNIDDIEDILEHINNLEDIWNALDYHYRDLPNKLEIVSNLMNQIVDLFIFDILTYQSDRHFNNWSIIEEDDNISLAPIYDNELTALVDSEYSRLMPASYVLAVDSFSLDDINKELEKFIDVSEFNYKELIKDKMWIISNDNLKKAFSDIEKKIGYPIPKKIKENSLNLFREHRNNLEEVLNIKKEKSDIYAGKSR